MTTPRLWLHAQVVDRLTTSLAPVRVFDDQPTQRPPIEHPDYVVIHPHGGQSSRAYLDKNHGDLDWLVTIIVAGMTRRAVLALTDRVDQLLAGWTPGPDPSFAAFEAWTDGAQVLAEGPSGWRPYSTSTTYMIHAPNKEYTP